MRRPIGLEQVVVTGSEHGRIAHLDRVLRACRETREKVIERGEEGSSIEAGALEFKNKGAEALAQPFPRGTQN